MNKFVKALVLTICILACSVCFVACSNGSSSQKSQSSYKKIDGEMTFCKYIEVDGETTFDLGAFAQSKNVEITRIRAGAFEGNENLKEIIIPDTVTKIDAGAFARMNNLEKLTIPFVGSSAVADSYENESASQDKSVNEQRLFGYIFGEEEYDFGTKISQNYNDSASKTYYLPWKLKTVVIQPKNVYTIPMYAFNGNKLVQSVTLSEKVISFGEHAFENCVSLSSVNLPTTLKKISNSAFKGCFSLTSISLPNTVEEICDNAFSGCSKLKTINLNSTALTKIGKYAFAETKLSEVTLSTAVTKIEEGTFNDCTSLKKVTATSVIFVGMLAFEGCTAFESFNSNTAKVINLNGVEASYRSFANLKATQTYEYDISSYNGSLDAWLVFGEEVNNVNP